MVRFSLDWSAWVGVALLVVAGAVFALGDPPLWLGVVVGAAPVLPVAIRLLTVPADATAEQAIVDCGRLPRRLQLRLMAASLLAASLVLLVTWVLKSVELAGRVRLVVALMPVPAFALFIAAEVGLLRRMDELQQRIQLEALAIAFPAAALLGITVEYLQKAGFARALDVGDVWPWMLLLYVPGYIVARWRYR